MRPVLVMGVGRCGTSAVARALHEEGGVRMAVHDEQLDDGPCRQCPEGCYEDTRVRDRHKAYLKGDLGRWQLEYWIELAIRARKLVGLRWGVKDPRMCHVARSWFEGVPEARVVICDRDYADVLAGWQRLYGTERTREHQREIQARALSLEAALVATEERRTGPTVRLDMNRRRSTAWILEHALGEPGAGVASAGAEGGGEGPTPPDRAPEGRPDGPDRA